MLGIPTHVEKVETGEALLMNASIKDYLDNGDRVKVLTSMEP